MDRVLKRFNSLFVLWVVLFSIAAYCVPAGFAWFRPLIKPGLGIIMLGMGITLVPEDFLRVRTQWRAILIGAIGQFGLMPLGAVAVTRALSLPDEIALGVILVCACPGGTASNVIAYLAKADVALSVSMTAISTLLSPVLTPLLLQLWAGTQVTVDFSAQAIAIMQIVVLPVLGGLILRSLLEASEQKLLITNVLEIFPSISISVIVLIVACIVALNAARIPEFGMPIVAAVMLTNAIGLLGGYTLARLARCDEKTARTIAIEVGMQNSGLGVTLANQFFTATTALPSAFFSLWHNITGPLLASMWSARPSESRHDGGRPKKESRL